MKRATDISERVLLFCLVHSVRLDADVQFLIASTIDVVRPGRAIINQLLQLHSRRGCSFEEAELVVVVSLGKLVVGIV